MNKCKRPQFAECKNLRYYHIPFSNNCNYFVNHHKQQKRKEHVGSNIAKYRFYSYIPTQTWKKRYQGNMVTSLLAHQN